jgi:uncharacterized membrane protein YccC
MDINAFELLEKKIDLLLELLHRLKQENEEFRQQIAELRHIVEEKEKQLLASKNEVEKYQAMQLEIAQYKDKQDRVKAKVERLIDKMKEFESLE